MLYSVRNVTEVPLDRQQVTYVLHSYLYNCNHLFTCFLSHQVFIFTHMISVHFSAFFMHTPMCNTLAVRTLNCRLLQHHFRDVALTPARITDITLSRMTCDGNHLLSWDRHSLATKKVEMVRNFGSIHTLRTLPDQGKDVCKVWVRSVQKCGFV
jgi:type III secretory pathway component EscU